MCSAVSAATGSRLCLHALWRVPSLPLLPAGVCLLETLPHPVLPASLAPPTAAPPLLARRRTVPTAQQQRLISEQLRRQAAPGEPLAVLGAPQRKEITELEAGPVVVRVLGAEEPREASASARDFLQQRLAGVRRSAEMLKPARVVQPPHLAARQQQHLAAARQGKRRPAAAGRGGGAPHAKRRR